MLVVPEFNSNESQVRTHPWSVTIYDDPGDAGAYYDFIKQPELIPHVLEDFKPFADKKAIQHFYQFLEWINGPESILETNDCAMRGPVKNESFFKGALRIGGRVEILYRDKRLNLNLPHIQWLWRMVSLYLQTNRPDFHDAVIEIAPIATDYLGFPHNQCRGNRLRLVFNVHGDTEAEVFDRLFHTFDSIWDTAKRISDAVKVPLPAFP